MLAFAPSLTLFSTPFTPAIIASHRPLREGPSRRSRTSPTLSLAPTPVLTPAAPPSWDSGALSSAVVRRFLSDEGERWLMWYGGRPLSWNGVSSAPPASMGGLVGLAKSGDGIVWERIASNQANGAVLLPNAEDWWWFDTRYVGISDVDIATNKLVRSDGGIYFGYTSGGIGEELDSGDGVTGIGVALSKDGENWTRVEGAFPSGAIFEAGPKGAWDGIGVSSPCILRMDDGGFMMYYDAFDAGSGTWKIGRALSTDGFEFERDGEAAALEGGAMGGVDAGGVRRCCVVRAGDGWVLFVEVIDEGGVGRIAACESSDGKEWGKRRIVLDVQEGSWDDRGLTAPSAVVVGDGIWMYYGGQDGRGIGLAVSRGMDMAFERVCGPEKSISSKPAPAWTDVV